MLKLKIRIEVIVGGLFAFNENDFGKKIQETYYMIYPKAGADKNDALIKNAQQFFILEYYK